MALSRSQIDRAGERIRDALNSATAPAVDDIAVVEEFRTLHVPGLLEVQRLLAHTRRTLEETLLRDLGAIEQEFFHVASRPKTTPAIVQKLQRSTTRLSRMQDIAGGRIVVPFLWVQDAVADAILEITSSGGSTPSVKDTREHGDALGYRAVHVIYQVTDLSAEIQIRSARQQAWAQTVELLDQRMGSDLKHGIGPESWQNWLRDASDALRNGDLGRTTEIPEVPS